MQRSTLLRSLTMAGCLEQRTSAWLNIIFKDVGHLEQASAERAVL